MDVVEVDVVRAEALEALFAVALDGIVGHVLVDVMAVHVVAVDAVVGLVPGERRLRRDQDVGALDGADGLADHLLAVAQEPSVMTEAFRSE